MAGNTGTLYVIGNRDIGVLYVLSNPYRVAIVSKYEIADYASGAGISFDEAFGRFAQSSIQAIIENDGEDVPAAVPEVYEAFGKKIASGATISDADFCFIGQVDLNSIVAQRNVYEPVQGALTAVTQGG